MQALRQLTARGLPLRRSDVDTDQIIPARFLKTTVKSGLGKVLFYDWRYDEHGNPRPDFVLNRPEYSGAKILLAGNNFGCGSSREHAPWALFDFGFRALISTSFADIFRNNCLKNGILPIVVDKTTHTKLFELTCKAPLAEAVIDLEPQALVLPDGESIHFSIDPYSKKCLLLGLDDLGYLLTFMDKIVAYEQAQIRGE